MKAGRRLRDITSSLTKRGAVSSVSAIGLIGLLAGLAIFSARGTGSPESCSDLPAGELAVVSAAELEARGLTRVGPLVEVNGSPLLVSNRPDRAIVQIPSGTTLLIPGATEHAGIPALRFDFAGDEFRLISAIATGQDFPTVILKRREGFPNVIREPDSLVLVAPDQAITLVLFARGEDSARYRLALASNGDFYIEKQALPGSTTLDEWTGEIIHTAQMQKIGRLDDSNFPIDFLFTSCDRGTLVCSVVFRQFGALIGAPVGGELRCLSEDELSFDGDGKPIGELEIDAGSFLLRVREAYGTSPNTNVSWQCPARLVAAGDLISSHNHFSVTAFRNDGTQLSVAVSLDGSLHVGDVKLSLGCPCTSGN